MSTKAVVISVFVVLAGVALTLYFSSSTERIGNPSAEASAPTALENDVSTDEDSQALPTDAPATTLSRDSARNDGPNGAPPGVGEAQASLADRVPSTPMTQSIEELRLPPVPEILETERSFGLEGVDPLWSTSTEGKILDHIAQITGLRLETLHVECRTSMCRLQLSQRELPHSAQPSTSGASPGPHPLAFMELVGELGLQPRWVMSVVDRNGNPTSLAYLARGAVGAGDSIEIKAAPVR